MIFDSCGGLHTPALCGDVGDLKGSCYRDSGDNGNALKYYKQALSLCDKETYRKTIEQRISEIS